MSDLKRISSEVRFKLDDAGKQAEKGTLKRHAYAVRVGAFLFLRQSCMVETHAKPVLHAIGFRGFPNVFAQRRN